jgi:hypothetical protein
MKVRTQKKIRRDTHLLADLGFVVHPRQSWPERGISYGTRSVVPNRTITFHTTQDRVSEAIVEARIARLEAGERPEVEVLHDGTRYWVIDGHHLLVAYLLKEIRPRLALHSTGPHIVSPPRYSPR